MVFLVIRWSSMKVTFFIGIFLVNFIIFSYCHDEEGEGETVLGEFLICRSCGSDAALSNFLIDKLSPNALASAPEQIFRKRDVLVQILQNPVGVRFEVIILKRASCALIGIWNTSHSWFPGYAWKLCLCPRCGAHLGWMFEPVETATKSQSFPSEKGFYVLILDNIIAESYVKSLLITNYYKGGD